MGLILLLHGHQIEQNRCLLDLCGGNVLAVLALKLLSFYLLDNEVVVVGRAVGAEPERALG